MTGDDKKRDISQFVEGMPNWAWQTYFAPEKGLIPQMNRKLNDICNKMDSVERTVQIHNNYEERLTDHEKRIVEQKNRCDSIQDKKEFVEMTESEFQQRLREERDAQERIDWRRFTKIIKLIGTAAALIGALVALAGVFIF